MCDSTAMTPTARPNDSVDDGNLPGIVHAAMRQDLEISPPDARPEIVAKVQSIQTRADAERYLTEVKRKVGR